MTLSFAQKSTNKWRWRRFVLQCLFFFFSFGDCFLVRRQVTTSSAFAYIASSCCIILLDLAVLHKAIATRPFPRDGYPMNPLMWCQFSNMVTKRTRRGCYALTINAFLWAIFDNRHQSIGGFGIEDGIFIHTTPLVVLLDE